MTGEAETISWGVFPLKGEDALYVRSDGGGGFGDPLEREPARVQADVEAGMVSEGCRSLGLRRGNREWHGGRGSDAGPPRGAALLPARSPCCGGRRMSEYPLSSGSCAGPQGPDGATAPRAEGAEPSERSERPAIEGT